MTNPANPVFQAAQCKLLFKYFNGLEEQRGNFPGFVPGIHVFLQGYGRVSKRSSQSGFCLRMSLTFQVRGQCFKVRSR